MTGCRVAAAAGLLLLVAIISAHTEIRPKSDPLCIAARCKDSEVCVVKNGEPQCISKQKIIKLARKHGLNFGNKHHPVKPHHKHQKHEEHAQHDRLGQHSSEEDGLAETLAENKACNSLAWLHSNQQNSVLSQCRGSWRADLATTTQCLLR